jgi:hypothetical protein
LLVVKFQRLAPVAGYDQSNSRKNRSGLGVEDAFGAAQRAGGPEGKRLTYYKSSPHWERERLDGPCV